MKSPATRKLKSETNNESSNENGEKSITKYSAFTMKEKDTAPITKDTATITKVTVGNTSPLTVETELILNDLVMIEKNSR